MNLKLSSLILMSAMAQPAIASDSRQTIVLSETDRQLVLSEMRMFLEATQSIMDGALNDDMKTVAAAAKPLGMTALQGTPPSLRQQLPEGFMVMGRQMHESLDMIAMDAEAVGDRQHTLEQLNSTLQQCIACHSTYRIDTPQMLK